MNYVMEDIPYNQLLMRPRNLCFAEKCQFVDFIYAWLYMEYGYLYRI